MTRVTAGHEWTVGAGRLARRRDALNKGQKKGREKGRKEEETDCKIFEWGRKEKAEGENAE